MKGFIRWAFLFTGTGALKRRIPEYSVSKGRFPCTCTGYLLIIVIVPGNDISQGVLFPCTCTDKLPFGKPPSIHIARNIKIDAITFYTIAWKTYLSTSTRR